MALTKEDKQLIITPSRLTPAFCLVIFLAGVYQCYLLLTGKNYDVLGLCLCLLLPLLITNFIYPLKIIMSLDSRLAITSVYLFRKSIFSFNRDEIRSIRLSKRRGGSASSNYNIDITLPDDHVKSFPLFTKLQVSDERKCVEEFLKS